MTDITGRGRGYDRVFLGIACTITAVWAVGTIVQIIFPAHAVPTTTNYVMMAVAGSFFGGAMLAKRNGSGTTNKEGESK